MRKAINVVIIENGCILLVQKRKTWILPGGKPEIGESDIQCLLREISEELPRMTLHNLKYFGAFSGITPHQRDELIAEVYFADANGEAVPSAEINAVKWTDSPEEENLSDITQKIVFSLRNNGYL
jgi:8-oxo-dGTP diphosphatase